jgi:hypothetical protein
MVTPEQARAELARRELAKRQSATAPVVDKKPSMLDNMKSNLTSNKTRPIGLTGLLGVGLSSVGVPEEASFPVVGDIAGTTAGAALGLPGAVAGSFLGTGLGEIGKQAAENVRGTRKGMDYKEAGENAALSGGLSLVTGGLGKAFLGKGRALNFLKNEGKQLADMVSDLSQKSLQDPNLTVSSVKLLNLIDDAIAKVPPALQSGQGMATLKRLKKAISASPVVNFNDLYKYEQNLGEIASFESSYLNPNKNKALNAAVKGLRSSFSSINDDLAKIGGYDQFGALSKKVGKAFKKAEGPKNNPMEKAGRSLVTGLMTTGVTGNPLLGALAAGGEAALEKPAVQRLVAGLFDNPVSRTANVAGREVARGFLRKEPSAGQE